MKNAWEDPPSYGDSGGAAQLAMPPMTPVVRRLIIANIAIFLTLFLWALGASSGAEMALLESLGLGPRLWKAWFPFLPLWQLVTAGFLHSFHDPWHVILNMLLLYFLGGMLEGIIGGRRFLVVYLGAMVAGWVLSLLAKLALGTDTPSLGASGAVLGVTVACAVLQPQARIIFIIIPVTLKWLAIVYVGLELLLALQAIADGWGGSRDVFAHLGGIGFGFASARLGWIWRDPIALLQARVSLLRERRHAQQRRDAERRVDELLQRIHSQGINSLSDGERAFLRRVAKRR